MAVVNELLPRIIKSGLGVLSPIAGIEALSAVVGCPDFAAQLVISPFDWPKLMAGAEGNVFPVFQEFAEFATPKAGAMRPPKVPFQQKKASSEIFQVSTFHSLKFVQSRD